ncbi:MAG: PilZ domain-containing protein [Planctomycetota bacterium]
MDYPQLLSKKELRALFCGALNSTEPLIMTHLSCRKWQATKLCLEEVHDKTLTVRVLENEQGLTVNTQIDQPVGLSVRLGNQTYICESAILAVNSDHPPKITLEFPDQGEKLQRRNYLRVAAPPRLKIQVFFWRSNRRQNTQEIAAEQCWQARLLDLSAGGMQLAINHEDIAGLEPGQMIGLQFTPMPYEKPLLLEGRIKRIVNRPAKDRTLLGLEILGLEVTTEGRERLHRICRTVENYCHMNESQNRETVPA